MAVANANGVQESDARLGHMQKSDFIDKKIADAAFELGKDEVSGVVEGAFTTVLLRVTSIEPGKVPAFEEVKEKVRDQLEIEWANSQLQEFYGKVEDGRAEGKPLKDIAGDIDIPFYEVEGVTRGNVDPNEKPGLSVPNASEIIAQGFRGQIGLEGEPITLTAGGYAWVDVRNITESAQQPFDEVKDDVKRFWTNEKKRNQVIDETNKFIASLKSGADFSKVAEEAGGTVQTTAAVGRTTIPDGLSQNAMTQAFTLKTGEYGSAETADGISRTIFRVDEIKKAPELSVEMKQQLHDELLQQLRTDSISAYVAALQKRFGVDINQALLRRVTGADQANP